MPDAGILSESLAYFKVSSGAQINFLGERERQ